MPQNIPPHTAEGSPALTNVPKSLQGNQLGQVQAMRDVLLNYVYAVEQELATAKPAEPAKPAGGGQPAGGVAFCTSTTSSAVFLWVMPTTVDTHPVGT